MTSKRGMRVSRKLLTGTVFLLPALLLFTVFVTLPLIEAGSYAGYRWSGFGAPEEWIGLRNFEIMADHSIFHRALWNTGAVILVSILVQIPLALCLAILIFEKSWSNTIFRLIFFLPFILAEVATGLIWAFIFDGDYGAAAAVTRRLGTEPAYLLADRTWAFPAILFVVVWKFFGFHMMIFIAALQSLPAQVIDAARLDGAQGFRLVWHVKLPLLRPAIAVSVFLAVIGSLQLFDMIAPMTGGGPSHTTHTLVSYLYSFGLLRLKVGFGSAVGLVLFAICVSFALIYQNTALRKRAT